ncbi:hypothetical protein HK100_008005 [Physocladia obscura]|uniref:NAD(P)-binding domain-containing protein n=1 Tax=Physocladia obscura TaxID=109957 RepID=A0AAD5SR36_9FUNG|nr:hypothetical protein HK100_008005 [Physocladia obscura]
MVPLKVLVVRATGKLGQSMAKLDQELGLTVKKLAAMHIGDAANAQAVLIAASGVAAVLNCVGANAAVALAVAHNTAICRSKSVKLIHVAATTNVLSDDRKTFMWEHYAKTWVGAKHAFQDHLAAINAIKAENINFVVFCPGWMHPAPSGSNSKPPVQVRVNRLSGDHISYEDAAFVMVDAMEKREWDKLLITASTDMLT